MNHCTTPAQARELGRLQALLGAEQEKSKGLQEKIERYITAYDEGARKLLALEISDASLRSLQEEQAKVWFSTGCRGLNFWAGHQQEGQGDQAAPGSCSTGALIASHAVPCCKILGRWSLPRTRRSSIQESFQRLVHLFCAVWFSFSLLGQIMESKDKHISWLQNQIEKVQEPTEKALHLSRLLQSHILHVFSLTGIFFPPFTRPAVNPGVGTGLPEKTHHRASAQGPSAMLSLWVPLTECFFTIHTPSRQSWRGHMIAPLNPGGRRIAPLNPERGHRSLKTLGAQCCTALRSQTRRPACPDKLCQRGATQHSADILAANRIAPVNPGVGTGLLHSILAWAQDCPGVWKRGATQHSADILAANRIAPLNPGVGAGLPRCLPLSAHCYTAGR